MPPLVELIEQCRGAVDEVINVTGRAAIQAVLELSAQQVTGGELSQPGKKRSGDVVRWGRQSGRVRLSDRKLRVDKPRLCKRSGGEVEAPAYQAMQDDERLGSRMLDILMKGGYLCSMDRRRYARRCAESSVTFPTTLPRPQAAQRAGSAAEGGTRAGQSGDPRRLAADDQARLEKLAAWCEGDWPAAAASLREGKDLWMLHAVLNPTAATHSKVA